jgi:hypothetical protein
MDKLLKSKSVLIYDPGGHNVSLAERLTREFGRVQYFRPWKSSRPKTMDLIVGDGLDGVERVRDFFTAAESSDLIIFPDIYDADMQRHFINQGKRVWGSRRGEDYEYRRAFFLKTLEKLGLQVSPHTACTGMKQLCQLLEEKDDLWIKVDLRGDGETWHHQNWQLSQRKLELLALQYGPFKELIKFTVCESINATNESAYDGFMVTSHDGRPQFSDTGFLGYEHKNQSHILHAIPYDQFPDSVRAINDEFAPVLSKTFFRSAFGTEIKNTDDGDFFLDATCRQPEPPGSIIQEQVKNLGEFMYYGAEGENVPLEIEQEFGVQVMLYSAFAKGNYLTVQVPEDDRQWFKFYNYCQTEGAIQVIPPDVTGDDEGKEQVGAVVALGDSIEDAIVLVKERCEMVQAFDIEAKVESLAEVLKRIQKGEEEGVNFQADIPEPAEVLE